MSHLSGRQLFLQNMAQTSDFPLMLEIDHAEGINLHSTSGKIYKDLIAGIAVSNVGHCHPKVVQAVKDQAEKYMHLMVYGEYIQSPQVSLAQQLVSLLPGSLDSVYFVNSGTEATEGAMKLAKRFTGRSEIISCHKSYHGSTQGALSVMGNEFFKQAFRPLLPDIKFIDYGSLPDLRQITARTAAVIIETIQGEAGVRIASVEYFELLRKKCDETGTLLILDEIQTGFGRTGKLWAFEHYGIVPDIMLIAKGMGGGMPIGAFISSRQIMAVWRDNPVLGHITTFGGHPVSCAAALASLEVIIEEELISSVATKANLFCELLKHPAIKKVRNKGLMFAVEFESFELLKKIIDRSIERGVITDWFLHCNNSMRIAPPLIISLQEIKEVCAVLLSVMDELSGN